LFDLRTLLPIDVDTIVDPPSTRRVVIVHDAVAFDRAGAEIRSILQSDLFGELARAHRRGGRQVRPSPAAAARAAQVYPSAGS